MVDMLDSTGRFQSRQLTEFYLVYGNISDGTFMRRLLLEFAKSHFDTTLIKLPILYQLKFYQVSAKATINSVKFARNEAGYTEEDCFAVITFDEHGRHQITLSKQTMP